jgi:rare lipoprotein A
MRKKIFVLLAIGITALTISQTLPLNKQKNETDTIKKTKNAIDQSALQGDSLILSPLKWNPYKKSVMASYYANKFNGKRTASGKRFSNSAYTAAHKKLPFGTTVKVTNEANGQFVIVEVTDRGPFVRSKEIDLSKRAFMEIAQNKKSGIMKVTLEIMEK